MTLWHDDLMDGAYHPYCKLCKHEFEWGESAVNHYLEKHLVLCYEIKAFRDFTEVVMNNFASNTKIDAEEQEKKEKKRKGLLGETEKK